MDRDMMMFFIKRINDLYKIRLKEEKNMPYKELYERLIILGNFVALNNEIPDEELDTFMRLYKTADFVHDPLGDPTRREVDAKILDGLITQKEWFFANFYGYNQPNAPLREDSRSSEEMYEELKEKMHQCELIYTTNSEKFNKLDLTREFAVLYDEAMDFIRFMIETLARYFDEGYADETTFKSCTKDVTAFCKYLIQTLDATSEAELAARGKDLQKRLTQLTTYYSVDPKKMS